VEGGRVALLSSVPVLPKLRTARQAPMASDRGWQKEEEEEEGNALVPAASPCTRTYTLP
jgi:hypothetical protein